MINTKYNISPRCQLFKICRVSFNICAHSMTKYDRNKFSLHFLIFFIFPYIKFTILNCFNIKITIKSGHRNWAFWRATQEFSRSWKLISFRCTIDPVWEEIVMWWFKSTAEFFIRHWIPYKHMVWMFWCPKSLQSNSVRSNMLLQFFKIALSILRKQIHTKDSQPNKNIKCNSLKNRILPPKQVSNSFKDEMIDHSQYIWHLDEPQRILPVAKKHRNSPNANNSRPDISNILIFSWCANQYEQIEWHSMLQSFEYSHFSEN